MTDDTDLARFVEAQSRDWQAAWSEIAAGRKTGHWIWYVFPQLRGLGRSRMSRFYGLAGRDEAAQYLAHEVLGPRLLEIHETLQSHAGTPPETILGDLDAMKVQSSATLFAAIEGAPPIFARTLDLFYGGRRDQTTEEML